MSVLSWRARFVRERKRSGLVAVALMVGFRVGVHRRKRAVGRHAARRGDPRSGGGRRCPQGVTETLAPRPASGSYGQGVAAATPGGPGHCRTDRRTFRSRPALPAARGSRPRIGAPAALASGVRPRGGFWRHFLGTRRPGRITTVTRSCGQRSGARWRRQTSTPGLRPSQRAGGALVVGRGRGVLGGRRRRGMAGTHRRDPYCP